MTHFLEVKHVNKSFGRLQAIDDVSFTVDEGEIYGIAGPNGAGKTTLFNTISGIPFGPDSGEILLNGRSLQKLPPHKIAQAGIMRTFQKETSFPSLSVRNNIQVGAVYGSTKIKNVSAAVDDMLALLSLTHVADTLAENLTLFEEKRLMIASALVTKPKLLMLDEPASGLNAVEIEKMADLIRQMNARGVTILLIEHVLPLLLSVSERIMILNYGSLLTEGLPKEVVSNPEVIAAYLGKGEQTGA